MKKLLLVVIITVLGLTQSANAQEVDFGVKFGLNVANLSGGDADRNNLFTVHAGIVTEFKISDKFSVQPELLFSRQGSEVQDTYKIELEYMSFPLLAKYYLYEKLSVEAGPQFNFLAKDRIKSLDRDIPGDDDTEASSFDFGVNIGFAYDITNHLFAQVRYNHGISTVIEDPDVRNNVFQLSLGYKF
ncbi:porin family protein [Aquimarina brevivitae]|uniref:Outer membrane protein with beta-barrel domain n=1 Tax=Aquimarina brevivitae TaxID=323412 RepID=A0A4Q7PHV9_9FLAO|nr:porin family protein [Aquimarina brevivitae]RZT00147.1 outer membrane protein with beta-barrel domain [Aquimarina brevivitae]